MSSILAKALGIALLSISCGLYLAIPTGSASEHNLSTDHRVIDAKEDELALKVAEQ